MTSPLIIRAACDDDIVQISRLHERVFGPGRFARTAYRVRQGAVRVSRFCRVAFRHEQLVASLSFCDVTIGEQGGALLLGPFAVDPTFAKQGVGGVLMESTIGDVENNGVRLIVLVGDDPYYSRYGFVRVPLGQIVFPGPVDPARILARSVRDGQLSAYCGMIAAAQMP